jgi:hypothetical protein
MALSGDLNSWLMPDKKSDFAKLAFSAADLAISISTLVSCKACSKRLRPDGHPNSPTYGHLKFPHPERGVMAG